jgi:hypothetical protein
MLKVKEEERKERNECTRYMKGKEQQIGTTTQCLLTVGFSFIVGLTVTEKVLCINEVETILLATILMPFKISTIEYTNLVNMLLAYGDVIVG